MSELAPTDNITGHDPSIGLIEAGLNPAEQANFQGDWMLLQHERMMSSDFREKFEDYVQQHTPSLNGGEPGPFDKVTQFQDHYERQKKDFVPNMRNVYAAVKYGTAQAIGNGHSPAALGHGTIGKQGTVYSDAISGGAALTARQKNIIAAHEAYHGMVGAYGSAVKKITSGFDWSAYNELVDSGNVNKPSYLRNPDELTARMAQLKNYFGMSAGEPFTGKLLDYARSHYVEDTGLDNGMSVFFAIVTPETSDTFLRLMNTLPI